MIIACVMQATRREIANLRAFAREVMPRFGVKGFELAEPTLNGSAVNGSRLVETRS